MEVTPLDRLRLLVGEQAFQEAEARTTQDQAPESVSQRNWVDIYEDLDASPDEKLKAAPQSSRQSIKAASTSDGGCLSMGDKSKPGIEFCPILAVSRIHYKYQDKRPLGFEDANKRFFAKGKFWQRKWTLYYICSIFSTSPVILVPAKEVWSFLATINKELGLDWGFHKTPNVNGFLLNFPKDSPSRPRFLGISTSKWEFDQLQRHVPAEAPCDAEAVARGHQAGGEATSVFRRKVEMASALSKTSSRPMKAKEQRRMEAKEAWYRQLRRTQRYLGLRATNIAEKRGAMSQVVTFEEDERMEDALQQEQREGSPEVDPEVLAPYPFDSNVVFVCIDIEAYESNHNLVTEIGISTLDTRDIVGVIPGPGGRNWMGKIRARHFRIHEHSGYVNGEHVIGCPERFEKAFGKSEWISVADIAATVASCFRPPFSASWADYKPPDPEGEQPHRNIVLVGHSVSTDVDYLRRVGYNVKNLSNLSEIIDTANLYRALKHETQSASLATLLDDLKIDAWNLHNAASAYLTLGNDAAYTLQAMIGIAIKGLVSQDIRSPRTEQQHIEKAQRLAVANVSTD